MFILVALIVGCESTPHYNRTKVVSLAPGYPRTPHGSVKLYERKEDVPKTYDIIALLSVEGRAGEEAQFIKAFLYRAADLGADGVIFYRVSMVAGSEGILGFGNGGGLGIQSTVHNAVYRGEAIRLKEQTMAP